MYSLDANVPTLGQEGSDSFGVERNVVNMRFTSGLDLGQLPDGVEWMIALKSATISNSNPNISALIGNNTLRVSYDGGNTYITLTLPDGCYTLTDINNKLQSQTSGNPDIVFSVDPPTDLIVCTVAAGIHVDLTEPFGLWLGFNSYLVANPNTSTAFTGTSLPNVTNGVIGLYIHCSGIDQSYSDGDATDVLYRHSIVDAPPNAYMNIKPFELVWLPLQTGYRVNTLTVTLTCNTGDQWRNRAKPWYIELVIAPKREDM